MDENACIEEDFVTVAEENGNFISSMVEFNGLMPFLTRDKLVYARSVCVEEADEHVFLQYDTDVDGCVVELKSMLGVKMPVRHITVFHRDNPRLIRSFLKKHVNLTLYSRDQLSSFSHSVGFQLFYEYGWECWIGIVPSASKCKHKMDAKVVCEEGRNYFQGIRKNFQKRLFAERCQLLRSLSKNDMNDVQKFTILPDDQHCVMAILQEAMEETILRPEFERVQFCFRFGEKCKEGMKLDVFELCELKRVTLHSAMDISSNIFDLMWSMQGLQDVVGSRGVLSTCLSFRDCGNYQSNLDGKGMDISKVLRDVCDRASGELLFMQLYVDVPHRKPNSRFHPVSGCIAGGLVFHKETFSAFTRDANSYVSTLESNFSLMNRSSCRLEVVNEVREVKDVLHARDFINVDNVFSLLRKRALIVPFELGMLKGVQALGLCIVSKLKDLLGKYSGTGNIEAIWKCYQLELACEKLLWGAPFAHVSNMLSVNLGPGRLEASRSVTDEKGFLALERWTSCMSEEYSIPPCCVWTPNEEMQSKMRRAAGLHDVLDSSVFVVGRRMVFTLLTDLHKKGKLWCRLDEFNRELFSEQPTMFQVSGAVTLKRLSELLSGDRRIGVDMVFGYQCRLIRSRSQLDLAQVLLDGLRDMRLKHFPALKLYDGSGHASLSWEKRYGLWKVYDNDQRATEMQQSAMLLTKLVVAELEIRQLIYVSKLKSVPVCFPWISACVRKLSGKQLSHDQLVCVLSFISCIALMMNGWFVDYDRLQALCNELPIKQHTLKDLEIQSKLLLSHCNKMQIYRLHHSIATKIATPEKKDSATSCKEQKPKETRTEVSVIPIESTNVRRISDDAEDESEPMIIRRTGTCVPLARSTIKWHAEELEILYKVAGEKRKRGDAYEEYKEECVKEKIPFRGREAFRRKLQRVAKDMQ